MLLLKSEFLQEDILIELSFHSKTFKLSISYIYWANTNK